MSMILPLKALLGGLAVVIIALLTRSKNYYMAGLSPTFLRYAPCRPGDAPTGQALVSQALI